MDHRRPRIPGSAVPTKGKPLDQDAIRSGVLAAFEYSYQHDDWVTPLAEALDGVTAEEAAWRPAPDRKGIWDIVLHLTVWTDNIVERMRSGERARPAEGAWPAPPASPDEAEWAAAQQRLWDSLDRLRVYMEASSLEALAGSPYGLGDLLCRFVHNGYHIGQITKLRELREAGAHPH